MNSLIATVKLDMGRGLSNPIFEIYPTTDVPSLVSSFVRQQTLPTYTQTLILGEIRTQLSKHHFEIRSIDLDEKDQESTVEGEEIQNLQECGSEWKSQILASERENLAFPYSPIQKLKNQMMKQCGQASLRIESGEKQRKKRMVGWEEKKRREEKITFRQLKTRRIGKVYQRLKGRAEGQYLLPETINFRQFNLQMLKWLQQLFLDFDDDDFDRLTEQKFVRLVIERKLDGMLLDIGNKGKEV